ncbi:MAG: MSMEG_6728 family protein [Dehalococcoidales bacterium]|nr:MSMEG_6728 family protein [Dehalococcoidales bacterium]
MQTFLPYPEFDKSAAVLDRRRLGKQRVEAYQIIRAITYGGGWASHPIVKMWLGFENALKLYSNAVVEEWIRRGYRNNLEIYNLTDCEIVYPWWLGMEEFHASHRAALLAKDYGHYSKYGWREAPVISYIWYS